jgi:hypothetical protein
MANAIQQIGETGLRVTLEFPDAKTREDFNIAFRGWVTQYQQAASTQQLVGALAAKEAAADRGDDTSGYLVRVWSGDGSSSWYLDII